MKRTEMTAKAEATAKEKEKEKERLRCNTCHSERANLAILVRRYDLTHPPLTIYDST